MPGLKLLEAGMTTEGLLADQYAYTLIDNDDCALAEINWA